MRGHGEDLPAIESVAQSLFDCGQFKLLSRGQPVVGQRPQLVRQFAALLAEVAQLGAGGGQPVGGLLALRSQLAANDRRKKGSDFMFAKRSGAGGRQLMIQRLALSNERGDRIPSRGTMGEIGLVGRAGRPATMPGGDERCDEWPGGASCRGDTVAAGDGGALALLDARLFLLQFLPQLPQPHGW